jgi:hypothetical protein
MKKLLAVAALSAVALVSFGARADAAYGPSAYVPGPAGGDQFNFRNVDAASGRITVVRAYPQPGSFNCAGAGGYATFDVVHPGSASSATLSFSETASTPFAWITLSIVRPSGVYAGTEKLRFPLESGTLTLALPQAAAGPVTIRFGVEVASACPNVDGATAMFPSVSVTS